MRKDHKLRTASLLMALSILLLVLLQAYWLRNAWFDEYRRLKRDLGVILRETVVQGEMRQFLQLKTRNGDDTAVTGIANSTGEIISIGSNRKTDSAEMRASIEFNVSDSSNRRQGRQPFVVGLEERRRFEETPDPRGLFVEFPVLIGGNNLDSVTQKYRQALRDAGIDLSFVLTKTKRPPNDSSRFMPRGEIRISSGVGRQNQVRTLSSELIRADFESPSWYIFKQMAWQIIFALVMIIVTTAAFIFLYRNLVQQRKLSDLKNDFIANITHELKTPIATVGVAIEALKNFDAIHDAAKTKEYLDISGNELKRLNLLVDKVLRLSMVGQQQLTLQKEKIDIAALVTEVVNSMKLQLEKQGAELKVHTEGADFTTVGDRMHLLSVFYNLLDNALKYSPEQPVISITIQSAGGKISVSIKDNGIGISPDDRQKIFDKFYRVPHGNTHNIKGYGLGLSYVNEVIKAHGGSIAVESREGLGSEFIVTLDALEREA